MNLIFAGKNNKYGILTIDNETTCPFIYDEIKPNIYYGFSLKENNEIFGKKGKHYYQIDEKGKILKDISPKVYEEKTNFDQ